MAASDSSGMLINGTQVALWGAGVLVSTERGSRLIPAHVVDGDSMFNGLQRPTGPVDDCTIWACGDVVDIDKIYEVAPMGCSS